MDDKTTSALEDFRREIDTLDAQIVEALARRFKVCEMIAHFKKKEGIPMMQQARVEHVKQRCVTLGARHGLDPGLVAELYSLIIMHSCHLEDRIIGTRQG